MRAVASLIRGVARAAGDRPSNLLALGAALGAAPLLVIFALAGDATPRRETAPAFLSAELPRAGGRG